MRFLIETFFTLVCEIIKLQRKKMEFGPRLIQSIDVSNSGWCKRNTISSPLQLAASGLERKLPRDVHTLDMDDLLFWAVSGRR